MQNPFPHIIEKNTFWVSSERCCWWEEKNTLILSDLHFGKTGHFRKSGIGIPPEIYKADLMRLMAQLYFFKADHLIIVGDFTHSSANKELDHFIKWRKDFSSLKISLVKGNHDILDEKWYSAADINIFDKSLIIENFCFRHDLKVERNEEIPEEVNYTFVGHVHPGITLKGKGRQSLKFPCFYFTKQYCILPAFSLFTGTYQVERKKNETVYAISDNQLLHIL
ncbi:MAG TPA: ligase-associated DNA damage response endonuclease PdeM [Chitinophagaceae bacterium]|nr:ligase-associated DNA damage response endonuclease PdeM [Chitinophagaceae bacterium]MCB9056790.1 ligase-associated DNA damage response endonuclease PdeM [Chitinophagales bacterium]HPG10890.1 ligase-associated DNA damage response endonuclease PdeM [Chitinophagaceae bacterium]